MTNGRGALLGPMEQILMLATIRLGENAYGVPIRAEILHRVGKDVSIGAIYTTLDRLENKGFISSRIGDATPERGGRAKRYFKVEAPGLRALNDTRNAISQMSDGLVVAGT